MNGRIFREVKILCYCNDGYMSYICPNPTARVKTNVNWTCCGYMGIGDICKLLHHLNFVVTLKLI